MSVPDAGTKPQGSTADGHDPRESAKAAGVKAERSRWYHQNKHFICGKQGHKQWDCHQHQQRKAGKSVHGKSLDQTPIQQQQFTSGPAQRTRSTTTGTAPASATPRASGYQTASKVVVTKTEPVAPKASTLNDDDYVYICVPQHKRVAADIGLTKTLQHQVRETLVHTKQHQFFTPFRCSRQQPRHISGVEIPASFSPRESLPCTLADLVTESWIQ